VVHGDGKPDRVSKRRCGWRLRSCQKSPGHPFYTRLNVLLDAEDFDRFVEGQCARFYAQVMGRPSLAPGRYCPVAAGGATLKGSTRNVGSLGRASDSLAVRAFSAAAGGRAAAGSFDDFPGHGAPSTLESHRAVFTWVQQRLVAGRDCSRARRSRLDATTLEAKRGCCAASCDATSAESYQEFLSGLAQGVGGFATPTREDLARPGPQAQEEKPRTKTGNIRGILIAKVAKMKDGRTHLAHKAEH